MDMNTSPGPVVNAAAVQAVLAALVTLGWLKLDSATVATLATAIAAIIAVVVTFMARSKVTPTSNPRADDGTPLVPATDPAAPPTAGAADPQGLLGPRHLRGDGG